mmetsp:Transcript_61837/g.177989  ORF Transcript_61837/g.177989 Transcript_61837/m.177989 type:complete len:216 (-) Transcript_61837:83-730(-)
MLERRPGRGGQRGQLEADDHRQETGMGARAHAREFADRAGGRRHDFHAELRQLAPRRVLRSSVAVLLRLFVGHPGGVGPEVAPSARVCDAGVAGGVGGDGRGRGREPFQSRRCPLGADVLARAPRPRGRGAMVRHAARPPGRGGLVKAPRFRRGVRRAPRGGLSQVPRVRKQLGARRRCEGGVRAAQRGDRLRVPEAHPERSWRCELVSVSAARV